MIAQKKVNIHYPNQDFGEIEDEYWKTVILHGVPVEKYIVSNYGNVIGPQNKKLTWRKNGGSTQYPGVGLSCDRALFENRGFVPTNLNYKKAVTFTVNVHILVANAFLPLDDNIPEELDEYVEIDGKTRQIWSMLPDHTKLWIRSLLNVDHIDNDKSNPHVSNLTFVSPRKNNSHVKKQALEGSC
tara:strand:- start:31 stop:585 length:555 start_codon:yes stop_codon:yes gene_type:complete